MRDRAFFTTPRPAGRSRLDDEGVLALTYPLNGLRLERHVTLLACRPDISARVHLRLGSEDRDRGWRVLRERSTPRCDPWRLLSECVSSAYPPFGGGCVDPFGCGAAVSRRSDDRRRCPRRFENFSRPFANEMPGHAVINYERARFLSQLAPAHAAVRTHRELRNERDEATLL